MDEMLKNLVFDAASSAGKIAGMERTYSTYLIHLMTEAAKADIKKMHSTGRGTYAEVEYDGHLYKVNIEA